MKNLITIALLLIGLGSLSAQSFVRKTNVLPEKNISALSNGTLKILAVMVEFQQDNDGNTYGNGKFGSIYSKAYGDTILDPLPHDKKYFENHLEFAKNYFVKVSGGKLNIEYTVLPQIITVSKIMREYSPPPTNSSDLTNTGNLAQEVWQLAGTAFNDIDFSEYDLFTIFHAGVGKEFTPPGSLGGERDIPSIYFGLNSLKSIFGESFIGFPVNNFFIKNTMILPSTESRELETLSGTTLIQLTTNGLIVASIASHLGLPDLFNTETGTSAIGRLGLMDGEAIFGYSGVFPPEPSAWEKMYLGWIEPVVVKIENANLNVAAKLAAASYDTTLLKIPINSTEYYLVENRQRDVHSDGLRITSKIGDQVLTYNIDRDEGRFQWYGVDTLNGVIIDVDEFDWAVPGNGIIIWHIDEKIINENIAENKINVDINNKGVDVEEADGIQDIGEKFTDIFGETVIGQATEYDFWFSGNTSRLFKNKFSFDTKPNTKTNSGANSLITMENFSQSGNRMSFELSFLSEAINLISSFKLNIPTPDNLFSLKVINKGPFENYYYAASHFTLYEFDITGNLTYFIIDFSSKIPAITYHNLIDYVIGCKSSILTIYYTNRETRQEQIKKITLPFTITSDPVITFRNYVPYLLVGLVNGSIIDIELESLLNIDQIPETNIKTYDEYSVNQIASEDLTTSEYYSFINQSKLFNSSGGNFTFPSKPLQLALTKNSSGDLINVVLTEDNTFYVFYDVELLNSFKINSLQNITSFSITDLMGDGSNYILFSNGNKLEAYSMSGVSADNYPFYELSNSNFIGTPVSADFDLDGKGDLLAASENGNIYSIKGNTGELFSGFPISTGAKLRTVPTFFIHDFSAENSTDQFLSCSVFDTTNTFYAWSLSPVTSYMYWSSDFGNDANNSYVLVSSSTSVITDFFPTERVYNWPNPVYENETNIRYFVSEDSDVTIRIFDLAGDLVASLSDHAIGGYDNETVWNVSNVQSGVYYASIEVKSNSGKSANKVIKIAVIK